MSNWKAIELELTRIRTDAIDGLYRTAVGVAALMKDREYLTECGDVPDTVDKRLTRFSGVFALTPSDLRLMLEFFPNKDENYLWGKTTVGWNLGRADLLKQAALDAYNQQQTARRREQQAAAPQPLPSPFDPIFTALVPAKKRNDPEALRTVIVEREQVHQAKVEKVEAAAQAKVEKATAKVEQVKARAETLAEENARLRAELAKAAVTIQTLRNKLSKYEGHLRSIGGD